MWALRPAGENGRRANAAEAEGLPHSKIGRPSGSGGQSGAGLLRWASAWLMALALARHGSAADHGLALAYPVDGSRITIDGDLSDWADGLPRYAIEGRFRPVSAAGRGTRAATFQLGYSESENALYVAMRDQPVDHGEAPPGPALSNTNRLAVVWMRLPANEETDAKLLGFGLNFGPGGHAIVLPWGPWSTSLAPAAHFVAESQVRGDTWSAEYRLDVDGLTESRHRLRPGGTLELNVGLWRLHFPAPDDYETVGWVGTCAPHQPDGRGTVWLLPPEAQFGGLTGQVTLRDGQPPDTPKHNAVRKFQAIDS